MNKEISRRKFLEMAVVSVAGLVLAGCKKEKPTVKKSTAKVEPTPLSLVSPEITRENKPTVATTVKTLKEKTPKQIVAVESAVTATPESNKVVAGKITLTNVPEKVDNSIVDIAKGEFKNKTGVAPHIFADPGGLLVGPDFGGDNTEGWKTMYESRGSIQVISPVNQEVIRWPGTAYQNLPEGGFVFFSGGKMTVELREIAIEMPDKGPGHNYFFVARGLYPDGKQDIDRNIQVKITDYIPGHIEITEYQSRDKTNLAFISEEQFLQKAVTSHSSGTNCGAEGCSDLTLVALDVNTGALEVYDHNQKEAESLEKAIAEAGKNWQLVYSNYRETK